LALPVRRRVPAARPQARAARGVRRQDRLVRRPRADAMLPVRPGDPALRAVRHPVHAARRPVDLPRRARRAVRPRAPRAPAKPDGAPMNELLRRLLFLPSQSSSVAREIDTLHYTVIITTMAGVTLAAAIAAVFLLRYRRRTPVIPLTPRVSAPAWLEATVICGLLGMFCAWWLVGFMQYRKLTTPPADAMPIYVTAKQWMWKFAYPSGPSSADVLVVPVGRPVKLIMTSRDVIHSFYIPEFRIK